MELLPGTASHLSVEVRQVCRVFRRQQWEIVNWPAATVACRFHLYATRHWFASKYPVSLREPVGPAEFRVRSSSSLPFAGPDHDEGGISVMSDLVADSDDFWEKRYQAQCEPEELLYTDHLPAPYIPDWAVVTEKLKDGNDPVEILQGITNCQAAGVWHVLDVLFFNSRFDEAFKVLEWYQQQEGYSPDERNYCRLMSIAAKAKRADKAQELFDEMTSTGMAHNVHSYTCLVNAYADSGNFLEAERIVSAMVETGVKPDHVTYSCLIDAYGRKSMLDEMARTYNNMKTVGCVPDQATYSIVIQAYARSGLTNRMGKIYKDMAADGWGSDAPCVNQMIQAYAVSGSIKDMEAGYAFLRNERLSVSEQTIRAMALAYIQKCYFFQLGNFVKNAGLKRNNVKNLLWNLLLLSFAANFSMKNLEKEFSNMINAGFRPDLTTFNIRARAFSNMHMYWDLHITVNHMLSKGFKPDLITFDAILGAYLGGRLEAKLAAALQEAKYLHLRPEVRTESFVLEAFGKGEFHLFCEELLAHVPKEKAKDLCYADLVSLYLQYLKGKRKDSKKDSKRVI